MRSKTLFGIFVITLCGLLLLSGCVNPSDTKIQQCCQDFGSLGYNIAEVGDGMPNPASVFCQCIGGELIIKTLPDGGQYGVCKIGMSETEEWQLVREKCSNDEYPQFVDPSGGECKTDGDCMSSGCSGQLCVSDNTEPMFTTCEFKPEYACYDLTECGCVNGKCTWKQNQEFQDCLENPPELG